MKRIQKIREQMKNNGLDAMILTSPANRYYASGFSGSEGIALIMHSNCFLLVDARYTTQAASQAKEFEIIECKGSLLKKLGDFKMESLGFEASILSYNDYKQLKQVLTDCSLHDCSKILSNLRMVKDKTEIERIKKSIALADSAFSHICGYLKEGITEREIAIELEVFMRAQGASSTAFETIVASGARSAMPHGTPTDKRLKKGDFVVMDFGCVLDSYCSDITRTFVIGEATDKHIKIYKTVQEAQSKAMEHIKAGIAVSEADAAARGIMAKRGYDKYFTHALGHGLGIEVHEEPRIHKNSNTILEENMVITIEPGIYINEFGGVRIEDLLVVTKDGYENLTKSSKELIIV